MLRRVHVAQVMLWVLALVQREDIPASSVHLAHAAPSPWRAPPPSAQTPHILRLPFASPSPQLGGEFVPSFVLLPNGSTLLLHVPGYCAGLPAGCGIPQAIHGSTTPDAGKSWSPLRILVNLTSPPNCSDIWKPGYCGWNTPAIASSPDFRHVVAVVKAFPFGDFAIEVDWDGDDFDWRDAATPRAAFIGSGKQYPQRGVDSGGTCSPITLKSGRTVFSFEWDNFSAPDASPQHANATLCYLDRGAGASWRLSRTQAPVGHPVRNGVMKCDGANEPSSVELNNGSVLTFIRTQTGYLWQALSTDEGASLSAATPTRFVSSDSPPLLLRLRHPLWQKMEHSQSELASEMQPILLLWINGDTSMPLACVDSSSDCVYATRFILHAAISFDDGESWAGFREVYRDPYLKIPPASTSGDYGAAYTYATEQADGSIIFETGQSGVAPARWNIVSFDPRFLLQTSKIADFGNSLPGHNASSWNDARSFQAEALTSCTYFWNLCKDPQNLNTSAPHCDRGGDGVQMVKGVAAAVCAALSPPATQATWSWNFPAAAAGALSIGLMLQSEFSGANISLTDFFAPSWDTQTDGEGGGRIASLLVLPLAAEHKLPTEQWLNLTLQWNRNWDASWSLSTTMQEPLANGTLQRVRARKYSANAPSYLRVRALGPGGLCVRSMNMRQSDGS
eukprot:SAG31_NODE_959_length_10757_cov_2.260086_3_plen_677_part_00